MEVQLVLHTDRGNEDKYDGPSVSYVKIVDICAHDN